MDTVGVRAASKRCGLGGGGGGGAPRARPPGAPPGPGALLRPQEGPVPAVNPGR
eukprot:SAG31_NODE_22390_length_526_cov_10.477752_1_plen_53_part_01